MHYSLGLLDILLLSACIMFFTIRKIRASKIFAFAIVSMLLPYAYLLMVPSPDGLPLIPFIGVVAMILYIIEKRFAGKVLNGTTIKKD